jgi:hypothetical protein
MDTHLWFSTGKKAEDERKKCDWWRVDNDLQAEDSICCILGILQLVIFFVHLAFLREIMGLVVRIAHSAWVVSTHHIQM